MGKQIHSRGRKIQKRGSTVTEGTRNFPLSPCLRTGPGPLHIGLVTMIIKFIVSHTERRNVHMNLKWHTLTLIVLPGKE